MLAVVQRINEGRVTADGVLTAEHRGLGLLVLLGVAAGDTEDDANLLAEKIRKLRIFSDDNGKMNLSVEDIGGYVIVVSNFTLCGSYRRGNRPDYMNAAAPSDADRLYEYFISLIRKNISEVGTGVFGADMQLSITADGPVTLQLDSEVLKGHR